MFANKSSGEADEDEVVARPSVPSRRTLVRSTWKLSATCSRLSATSSPMLRSMMPMPPSTSSLMRTPRCSTVTVSLACSVLVGIRYLDPMVVPVHVHHNGSRSFPQALGNVGSSSLKQLTRRSAMTQTVTLAKQVTEDSFIKHHFIIDFFISK